MQSSRVTASGITMNLTRRKLLALTGSSLLLALITQWLRLDEPASANSRQADFRAWIDTLLPAEPDFPGALTLGVDVRIVAAIEREPAYSRLAQEAWIWLDQRSRQAGGAFSELPESGRQAIVAAAAASPMGTAQRTFFQASLDDALFHAYADPRAWAGLGYAGPPQPIGFPDHAKAPEPV